MKTYKKIGVGASLILLGLLFVSFFRPVALAAGGPINGTGEWRQATYTLNNKSQITVNLAGNDHDNIAFNGNNPTYTADTNGTGVCSGTITFQKGQSLNNRPIKASISVKFEDSEGPNPSCVNGGNGNYSGSIQVINNTSNGGQTPANTGPKTISYGGQSYQQIQGTRAYGLSNDVSDSCYGGSIIVLDSIPTGNKSVKGTVLPTSASLAGTELSKQVSNFPSINLAPTPSSKCYYNPNADNGNNALLTVDAAGAATFAGCTKGGSDCKGDPPADPSGTTQNIQCVLKGDLSWITCPVINGISEAADQINDFVEGQLNYDINANLTGSVHQAWSIFKNLASGLLIIVMLVMVISQAIGGGPFDAYTVKKLMPRLVAAIILMQISWYMCIWFIELANAAGQGVAALMAAPFGGTGSLELGSVVNRLSAAWAGVIGVGTTGLLVGGVVSEIITGAAILKFAWPILVLAASLVAATLVAALATLLIRNALIILLVMLSPIAFLAFVMPGAESLWKRWQKEFTRILVFFPMVMAIIYAGRIFAWTAGNLGKPGPLDVIMVLAGFFLPYFFLPKTFQMSGSILGKAAEAINESAPIKGGKKLATDELMERQKGHINAYAKDLDPGHEDYLKKIPGRKFGVLPFNYKGSALKTAFWNVRAGRLIPTERNLAKTIARGEKWNREEEEIAGAKIKRAKDKGASRGATAYSLARDEHGNYIRDANGRYVVKAEEVRDTAGGKAALFEEAGSADTRDAGMAIESALKTSSWVELGKTLVPISDPELQKKIRDSGAEVFETDPEGKGRIFVRMFDLPRYISKVNSAEDLYPLPMGKFTMATPHITDAETQSYNDKWQAPHHIARVLETIEGYLDTSNIASQSEAEYTEFGRLAEQDPRIAEEFGKLLGRMAHGGQGGINALVSLSSNASMTSTINALLGKARGGTLDHVNLEGYLQEAQANATAQGGQRQQAQPQQPAAPQQQQAPAPAPPQRQAPAPTQPSRGASTGGFQGTINIPHGAQTGTGGGADIRTAAQAMIQATENLNQAAHHMRQTSANQARTMRALGNIGGQTGRPGEVIRPDEGRQQASNEQDEDDDNNA